MPFAFSCNVHTQDWLQLQAKSEEQAIRREMNKGTADINRELAEERRLKELQHRVGGS